MTKVILPSDSTLYHAFEQLIASQRFVFFVGLPGVGKSLLAQQLALMAHQAGRKVHLLQWDVVRQPFMTDAYVMKTYPEIDGVTHSVIRKAVGLWVREAIGQWNRDHPEQAEMLIGEAPLVGNRLIELLQRHDDDVEAIIGSSITRFVIPVPSREVRRTIEGKRGVRSANPHHAQQQIDAIPQVLQAAWIELYRAAQELRITSNPIGDHVDFDPGIYQSVFDTLMKHRHSQGLPLTIQLRTEHLSSHENQFQESDLAPKTDEVRRYIAQVERLYPDIASLDRHMNNWYIV
jgi:hypothetical protein